MRGEALSTWTRATLPEGDVVMLWRLEATRAAQRFLEQVVTRGV